MRGVAICFASLLLSKAGRHGLQELKTQKQRTLGFVVQRLYGLSVLIVVGDYALRRRARARPSNAASQSAAVPPFICDAAQLPSLPPVRATSTSGVWPSPVPGPSPVPVSPLSPPSPLSPLSPPFPLSSLQSMRSSQERSVEKLPFLAAQSSAETWAWHPSSRQQEPCVGGEIGRASCREGGQSRVLASII